MRLPLIAEPLCRLARLIQPDQNGDKCVSHRLLHHFHLNFATIASAQIASDERPSDFDMRANASFEIETWEEEPFSPLEAGDKLTRVSVVKSYSGDIEGEGRLEYLMRYREDGSAEFFGL